MTEEPQMPAGADHLAWSESFHEMFALVAGAFENAAVRRHGRAYVLGLLSRIERKNSWVLADFAGDASPDGMQRLLNFSPWDEDACRDMLCRYVVQHLGDPYAVLAVDETGFPKKGQMSAGVARQPAGRAGQINNVQVGVFLAYVARNGSRALIDRELYLPEAWVRDRKRCRRAGIGDDVTFATKAELARRMIRRAADARLPFSWVTGGEVCGGDPQLRAWLEQERIPYVTAVARGEVIATRAGMQRADQFARTVPRDAWQRPFRAGESGGLGRYDWALSDTPCPGHWLLVRRSLRPGEQSAAEPAVFRCWSPRSVTLTELITVARARWSIRDCLDEARNETGLDQYQVRKYRAWYRHITLSMLAHAFLAIGARTTRHAPSQSQYAVAGYSYNSALRPTLRQQALLKHG